MQASFQCRGLGSAKLPARSSARTPLSRSAVLRVRCQDSVDQTGTAATVPSEAALPQYAPYPVPLPPPAPSAEGVQSQAVYPAGYPPYQVPQQRLQQEYYMAAPPAGYYPPPPPAYKAQETGSGAPWWIWVGVGVIAANVINKVQEFMKNPKTPQQMMTEMAMKQMMGAMGNQSGAASPFGKAGMPPFPGGMPPFPPGGFPAAASPAVDVTAAPAGSTSTATATPSSATDTKKGDKFASRLASSPPASATTTAADSANTTTTTKDTQPADSKPSSSSTGFMDVVEPIVKEPTSSSSSSRSSASFFADASTASTSSGSQASNGSSAGGAASGAEAGSGGVMTDMMENMLRNPQMQKMLYPYLPEPMRNPQSIEWMLNNPEVKKQMAAMFEQQNMMSPQMMEMMKNMDFNQDKVNQQFQELGLKPEDVISKVMANPELASGFQNPKVQAAIMDISQNPMNIMKYQSDPEVMKVLEQVTTLFQPDMAPNKR